MDFLTGNRCTVARYINTPMTLITMFRFGGSIVSILDGSLKYRSSNPNPGEFLITPSDGAKKGPKLRPDRIKRLPRYLLCFAALPETGVFETRPAEYEAIGENEIRVVLQSPLTLERWRTEGHLRPKFALIEPIPTTLPERGETLPERIAMSSMPGLPDYDPAWPIEGQMLWLRIFDKLMEDRR